MDQQNKTKLEENQDKTAELSDKDLEQVAGGIVIINSKLAKPVLVEEGPEERLTTDVNIGGYTGNHNETLVRETAKTKGVKVKANVKAGAVNAFVSFFDKADGYSVF